MALSKMERERREKNAQNLETFKALYHEFETMELPALNGSPKQVEVGEAKRQKYVNMLKTGYQRTMATAIKNGVGFQMDSLQNNINLLKTRTSAGRW
jgi:hypothetical protein